MREGDGAATPSQAYAAGAAAGDWQDDPAQRAVLVELDRIHRQVLQPTPRRGLLARLRGAEAEDSIDGLYLWGGVGRGKTFLIDLFHAGLPLRGLKGAALAAESAGNRRAGSESDGKYRTHFHRFMRLVHDQLQAHGGERDRLALIVQGWRRAGLRVLVLDEFFVSDIGDAMILARLLERMFAEGIVLLTTSNVDPPDLYRDGLQRARFEPAIELIQRHCKVLRIDSDTDYRLRALTRSPVYRTPLDDGAEAWLQGRWRELGGDDGHLDAGIELEGRRIAVRARSPGMAWFDFDALCEGPRGANDYIEIALEFLTRLLGGVPVLDTHRENAARRFVTLVD
ncbi:MAG: cell division protein ZapE, partial [Luteimonas sp.]